MLNKIAGFPLQDTGVGFYRIVQPLRFIKRGKLVGECRMSPFSGENNPTKIASYKSLKLPTYNDKLLGKIVTNADVIWSTLIFDELQIRRMLDLRKFSGAKWIVDIDDNMFDVKLDNPGRSGVEMAKDNIKMCLQVCDGITVSVPHLKELYEQFNKNIFVVPNGIDPLEWDYKRVKSKKIKIGWRGSYGHGQDFNLITKVLEQIKKDYDVEVHTFGVKPKFPVDYHTEWVPLQQYPETLASLGYDIAVIPLIDSYYNRSKSNIAYQEYSMLKIPVIVSPIENQVGIGALEARTNFEWYEHLEKLILDKNLRLKQGQSQRQYTLENFNVENFVKPLVEWMENLPRRTDLEP